VFVTLIVWDGWFEHEPLSSFYIRRTIFWGLRVNEKSQFGKALDILLLLLFLHLMLVRIWSRKYKSFCVHCSLLFTWISRYLETWEDVMEIFIKNRNLFRAILQGSFTWTRSFLLSNFSDGYVTKTAGTKSITITGHLFCSWPLWTKV